MRPRRDRSGTALLFALAATTVVVHCLVGGRYGFHRDELATLDDARHLAWGYVAYPPVTPFFGWLSLHFFGTSLPGFRFFASLAGAAAIVLTGLMARELGGTLAHSSRRRRDDAHRPRHWQPHNTCYSIISHGWGSPIS